MNRAKIFSVLIIIVLIMINSSTLMLKTEGLSSYSFVYSFGNAKIWVFIETNESMTIGPSQNGSILVTIYLEDLGTNKAVFLNRLTFDIKSTQFSELSPNVTLNDNARSWSYNIDIEQKDITSILPLGQASSGTINFEFRYDVIDSAGEYWQYRVNEGFPQSFVSTEPASQPPLSFEAIFVITLLLAIASAMVLLGLRIRKYKKARLVSADSEKGTLGKEK